MLSFSKWLVHQKTRTDAVGEFARSDYAAQPHATHKTMTNALVAASAPSETFAGFRAAWADYERVVHASGHTPKVRAKKAPAA